MRVPRMVAQSSAKLAYCVAVAGLLLLGCSMDLKIFEGPFPCTDQCSKEGDTKCEDFLLHTCARSNSGCLWWQITDCAADQVCMTSACVSSPVLWSVALDASSIGGDFSRAIWGTSHNDVFAAGTVIVHYDGNAWTVQRGSSNAYLNALWGASGSDVFAVGSISPAAGTILHYDGSKWVEQATQTTPALTGIWGSSGDDVFATGFHDGLGVILHYDGMSWSVMTTFPSRNIVDVWGSSRTDVFALASGRTSGGGLLGVLHYDGAAWTVQNGDVYGSKLWGSSPSDLFAVGEQVFHYDGTRWSVQNLTGYNPAGFSDLSAVWGSSSANVFVVGTRGAIFHYDGSTWKIQNSGTKSLLRGVWGASADDVFATGEGGVLHYKP